MILLRDHDFEQYVSYWTPRSAPTDIESLTRKTGCAMVIQVHSKKRTKPVI